MHGRFSIIVGTHALAAPNVYAYGVRRHVIAQF